MDTKDTTDKTARPGAAGASGTGTAGAGTRKPLSLQRTVESGSVRQNFSHGRSKSVVVEKKKSRKLGGSEAPAPAAPAPVSVRPVSAPVSEAPRATERADARTLRPEERDARARALAEARRQTEEADRRRAEQELAATSPSGDVAPAPAAASAVAAAPAAASPSIVSAAPVTSEARSAPSAMEIGKQNSFSAWAAPQLWMAVLTLILLLGQWLPASRFFSTPAHYLPLHTALEFIAMAVSAMVFALAWNLRRQAASSHALLLGCAFLCIGLIDLAHTLSYTGMPVLVTPSGPEKAINFWLAGRLIGALALLAVAVLPNRRWPAAGAWGGLLVALLVALLVWWIGLFHADLLPRTFIAGQGLTALKIGSEYVLTAIYLLAALLLWRRARREYGEWRSNLG